jgi:hypothetical protein
MKNNQIIDSWNGIGPDTAADQRMLSAILARNHAGQSEKKKVYTKDKIFNWKRLAPLAVCLVLVVALVAMVGNNAGWLGGNTLIADLGSSGTLSFYKGGSVADASFAWDADWGEPISRELTAEESSILFGDLGVTGYAIFRLTDSSLMHFEGKIVETEGLLSEDIKINLSASGFPVTDAIITGNEEVSQINGIPVTAGYFVTDANSKGERTIIYFASFVTENATVYVELAGTEANSDVIRTEIGDVIIKLTQSPPDMAKV